MTEYIFSDVVERDMDLLILRCFVEKPAFREFFLNAVGLEQDCQVLQAYHSLSNNDGESDLTFVVQCNGEKIGILVEDKINACAQPNQAERYITRGNTAIENGEYSSFKVAVVAPQEYLSRNSEVEKYEHQVSYEAMQGLFDQGSFEYQMIARALQKKTTVYEVHEVKEHTAFNDALYDYVKDSYPKLDLNSEKGTKKGPGCNWFSFRTPRKNCWIIYKSTKNYVDLELRGFAKDFEQIKQIRLDNEQLLAENKDIRLRKAGKSLALEIDTPYELDCMKPFEQQKKAIDAALEIVLRLQENVLPYLVLKSE